MVDRKPRNPRFDLAKARIEAGLSRAELGAKIGVGWHYVGLVENGRQDPSLPMMEHWAHVLGKTSIDMFKVGPPPVRNWRKAPPGRPATIQQMLGYPDPRQRAKAKA